METYRLGCPPYLAEVEKVAKRAVRKGVFDPRILHDEMARLTGIEFYDFVVTGVDVHINAQRSEYERKLHQGAESGNIPAEVQERLHLIEQVVPPAEIYELVRQTVRERGKFDEAHYNTVARQHFIKNGLGRHIGRFWADVQGHAHQLLVPEEKIHAVHRWMYQGESSPETEAVVKQFLQEVSGPYRPVNVSTLRLS